MRSPLPTPPRRTASLRFFFYGGIVVLPVIAAYTIGVYWVFRGKIDRFDPPVLSRERREV